MLSMMDLLTPAEAEAVRQPYESGSVKAATVHLGKDEGSSAIRKLRSTARAKLKAAGFDLPDLRKQKRSGCRRVPACALNV